MNCPLAVVTAYKSSVGVIDAVTNFEDKTVTVTYDSAKTNPESLLKVLAGTPYSATKFKDLPGQTAGSRK